MKVEDYLNNKKVLPININKLIRKVLLTAIVVLSILIICKTNISFKEKINNLVLKDNLKFSKINKLYNDYIFKVKQKTKETIEKVNKTKTIEYREVKNYKDGALLNVGKDYPIKMLESGLISYIGEKDNMKVVAVEQSNGIDVIYGNIESKDIKVYDYIEKDTIIGLTNNEELYLSFYKDEEVLDYKPYIEY